MVKARLHGDFCLGRDFPIFVHGEEYISGKLMSVMIDAHLPESRSHLLRIHLPEEKIAEESSTNFRNSNSEDGIHSSVKIFNDYIYTVPDQKESLIACNLSQRDCI